MLRALAALRDLQAEYEAFSASLRRAGCLSPPYALVTRAVLHDACTLASGASKGRSWFSGSACACGSTTYGISCTPPSVRDGRLVRERLDALAAFCWRCLARSTDAHVVLDGLMFALRPRAPDGS